MTLKQLVLAEGIEFALQHWYDEMLLRAALPELRKQREGDPVVEPNKFKFRQYDFPITAPLTEKPTLTGRRLSSEAILASVKGTKNAR